MSGVQKFALPIGGQFRIGGIVAAGAGFVSVPALFGPGGGVFFLRLLIMFERWDFWKRGIVAAGTGVESVPAGFRTGGGLRIIMHQSMII